MRARVAIVLASLGCGGGTAKEAQEPHAAAVLAACGRAAWYPGVTDASAPKAHLVVHLVNGLPEGVVTKKDGAQPGVCLLLDGQLLLSAKDQSLIESRADRKETINWEGAVAPGNHTIGMALSLHKGESTTQSVSGRAMTVTKGGIVTIGIAGEQGTVAWGADGDVTLERMR